MAASQETLLTRLDLQTLDEVRTGGWIFPVKPESRVTSLRSIKAALRDPSDRALIEASMPWDFWETRDIRKRRYPDANDAELVGIFLQEKVDKILSEQAA